MSGPPFAGLRAAGLGWHGNGQSTLTGPLYRLAADCDRAFLVLADACGAEPQAHPPLIDVTVLQAIDYLESFPHLATFAIRLDAGEANLKEFVARGPVDDSGAVRLTETVPVRQLLTPAACYPVYPHLRGTALDTARRITVRATCFRQETYHEPLRRQWSFQMRELVCLGTRAEVVSFLAKGRAAVDALCGALDLPVDWAAATDPFFEPARNPGYLAQRLRPTKHEARYGDDLAIASVNLHEDHFGAAFGITRSGGPAVSGCVAFGLERWLYALTYRYGTDPAGWPDVPAAARDAAGVLR